MANKTIGQLTAASAISDTDLIEIEQSGVSKQLSINYICPTGVLLPFASDTIPDGWLLCQGQELSRITYADLFSVIGTTFGVGNGSTTFNAPDMREASPYGAGTYSAVTGTTHGTITAHDALALGDFADDQFQGHKFQEATRNGTSQPFGQGGTYTVGPTGTPSSGACDLTDVPYTDGTNGTPRTGTVTRGKIIGLNFIIKY